MTELDPGSRSLVGQVPFQRLEAQNPDPRGELEYINPYTLLVAVVLSAQATDAGVNKATGPLFEIADTPQKMVALGEAKLRDYIQPASGRRQSLGIGHRLLDQAIALEARDAGDRFDPGGQRRFKTP